MLDDFALVKRASAGDRAAKAMLVRRIYDVLSGWASARVGWHNSDLVFEILQQTTFRVFAGALSQQERQQQRALAYRGSDRARDQFDAALRSVAEAELPRVWRAMHYRNKIAQWPLRWLVHKEWLTAPVHRPAYHIRIDFDEHEKQAVVQALARLPPRLREVAYLRYLEGCDFAELVRELGAAPVVVALRLYRATKLLVEVKRPLEKYSWWSCGDGEADTSWRGYEQWNWWRQLWPEIVRVRGARGRAGAPHTQPLVRVDPAELPDLPKQRRPMTSAALRRALRRGRSRSTSRAPKRSV